jgi:hypothetical protein
VRAWVDARNDTVKTGDVTSVADLSSTDCQTCVGSYGPVQQVYLDGGHYETDGWRISAAEVREQTGSNAQVLAGIVYAPGRTVPAEGAVPITYDTERHVVQFNLVTEDGVWNVASIVYLS